MPKISSTFYFEHIKQSMNQDIMCYLIHYRKLKALTKKIFQKYMISLIQKMKNSHSNFKSNIERSFHKPHASFMNESWFLKSYFRFLLEWESP